MIFAYNNNENCIKLEGSVVPNQRWYDFIVFILRLQKAQIFNQIRNLSYQILWGLPIDSEMTSYHTPKVNSKTEIYQLERAKQMAKIW